MSANVFVGQTEAPLLIRPYLEKMTKSEILCLMTGGLQQLRVACLRHMCLLGGSDPELQELFAKHLLTSIIDVSTCCHCMCENYPS